MNWQILINKFKDILTLQKAINLFFVLSFFILIFTLFLYPTNSTDLGWHLKYGEYFVKHGRLLKENTFSYSMPDFIWTNDSWVYDVLVYQIFTYFSFPGLAISGALVGIILTIILFKLVKTNWQVFLIALIPFYIIVHTVFYHGFRAQVVSLVFLALTMWIMHAVTIRSKAKIFLIDKQLLILLRLKRALYKINLLIKWQYIALALLFLFWANWHGEFMVGLSYIGLVLLGKTADELTAKRKLSTYKILLPIFLISLGASLITPFGIANFIQGVTHIFSSRLGGIGEWNAWPTNSWQWWSLLAYLAFLFWNILQDKKLRSWENFILLLLYGIQAILHRRMQGILAVISFPILVVIIRNYFIKLPQSWSIKLVAIVIMFFWSWKNMYWHQPWINNWEQYCLSQPNTMCSEGMITFLVEKQIKGKIFNFYNWGGYLIWRYPQAQVFIDGRMVSWQDHNSKYLPYQHYDTMMRADDYGMNQFMDQKFDYVLLPKRTLLGDTLLTKYGWRQIYQDKQSVILSPFYP